MGKEIKVTIKSMEHNKETQDEGIDLRAMIHMEIEVEE